MTYITPQELTLLRSRPHETNLWLSIYKPKVILACQINNGSAAPGDRIIPFDNTTQGIWSDVLDGMTMYIGTVSGARDVGRIRVRGATGTYITVAENSDIEWEDDLYLTVTEFWEINAVYPRMATPDPAHPENQVWYKDYDIPYTNQNDVLGTIICMGSHYAGFIDKDTGVASVYYTATGTHSLLSSTPLTYFWDLEAADGGGTSAAETPGTIFYSQPGHYTTTLTVTDSNGVVDMSHRQISIYNRPGEGANVPILNWELESLDGSRDAGGYTGRIKVRESTEDVVDGALVVIFADDTYGSTKQSIGGNAINRSSIFFVGYILDGSISYNYEDSSMEFDVGSPTEIMKLSEGFGVAVNSSTDPTAQDAADDDIPSAWALLKNMNCERALYHYLRWHSTALQLCDFQFNGSDRYIEYFDADRESLYDAVNNLMRGTLYGEVVCDRQGKIYAEVATAAYNLASFTGSVINITKQDWIGNPSIEEIYNDKVSYLEMGGIQFDPSTPADPVKKPYSGSSLALLACAPGTSPSYRGSVQKIEGMGLLSQGQLNQICGNIFAYLNSKFAHVEFNLSGNYRNIDIAPIEIVGVTVEASDTPRGIVWNNKAFHPTGMSWTYDPKKGTLLPTLTLHEATSGFDATAIVIPAIPPTTDPGGGGYTAPPVTIPPIVIPPFTGFIYVYHNGILVAVVSALNFVDS